VGGDKEGSGLSVGVKWTIVVLALLGVTLALFGLLFLNRRLLQVGEGIGALEVLSILIQHSLNKHSYISEWVEYVHYRLSLCK